ncbi:MAG: class I SAM-dependent methyltransferase family protein [Candidatus Bathyarchaeia archaeon]
MEITNAVKAYGLKVPKNFGERAIRLVANLGLLNKDLKVRLIDEHIYVPLKQKPTFEQVTEFEKELPQSEVLVQEFPKRNKQQKSLYEILEDKLPPHLLASFPRSIDFVGEIAIVEVPPELKEYRKLIGESILSTHKQIRTVLAKSSAISGIYRLREYAVIAGVPKTETIHREYGCKYYLDLNKVYFSPRLSYEHYRVASQVEYGETVIDMFAGVGPFSILIAKMHKNATVYAVDINPDAIEYLKKNIRLNRVEKNVTPILGDANNVVRTRLKETADRVIMNLPEKAEEYLENACNAIKPVGGVIHYYTFTEGRASLETIRNRLNEKIDQTRFKVEKILSTRLIREVAPYRWLAVLDIKIIR